MAKTKSKFTCQECGYESSGWLGKCPSCQSWNSFVEDIIKVSPAGRSSGGSLCASYTEISSYDIHSIETAQEKRFKTNIPQVDRVLGGGIVQGSLILVGGDPGIGKSTLLLQICNSTKTERDILYISGEESLKQIKLRADRLSVKNDKLKLASGTDFYGIKALIEKEKPSLVIIDSVQTMYDPDLSSSPGSVSQDHTWSVRSR